MEDGGEEEGEISSSSDSEDVIMLVDGEEEAEDPYRRSRKVDNLIGETLQKKKKKNTMVKDKNTKIERDFEHKTVEELMEDFVDE